MALSAHRRKACLSPYGFPPMRFAPGVVTRVLAAFTQRQKLDHLRIVDILGGSALGVSDAEACFTLLAHFAARPSKRHAFALVCVVCGTFIDLRFWRRACLAHSELDKPLGLDGPLREQLLENPDVGFVENAVLIWPIAREWSCRSDGVLGLRQNG